MSEETTAEQPIIDKLWNSKITAASYSDPNLKAYNDHVLKQYEIYVQTAEKNSERRGLANTFFLSLQTLLVTLFGYVYANGYRLEPRWLIIFPLIAVLTFCLAWWWLIRSYRQLNAGKFKVIDAFEKRLPTRPFVEAEWKALGEGIDPNLYTPFTSIERWIPIIFALLYLSGAVVLSFF